MKKTFALTFVTLFAGSNLFAQPSIPICTVSRWIQWYNDTSMYIYHQETESQCIGGTWHNLTYVYTFGNKGQIPLMDVDTGMSCSCKVGGQLKPIHLRSSHGKPVTMDEDNCNSPIPYDNSAASSDHTNDIPPLFMLVLTKPPAPLAKPTRPLVSPMGVPLSEQPQATTVTPGSWVFTLPYRALPAAPLLVGSLPTVTPACLSSVNPTHFETAHIDGVLKRVNSCTGATVATITLPDLPLQVRVTPDGSTAVVTGYDSTVSFVSTATNTVTKVLQLNQLFTPSGLAISPDGSYALITNLEPAGTGGAALGIIDLGSQTMTSMIPLNTDYPQSVFINPDATLAWVVYPFNSLLQVIDLMTGAVVKGFNFQEALSVAFNPTGTVAYVAGGGGVQVINTMTYAITASIQIGPECADALLTPDGAYLIVNSTSNNSVSVIDTKTLTVTTHNVSGMPRGMVAVPVM